MKQVWRVRGKERIAAFFKWDEEELVGASKIVDRGSSAAGSIGCCPSWPEPSMTCTPIEGMPFTTTKTYAGPGTITAGFGGSCETCSVAVLFPRYAVYDVASST